MPLGSEIHSFFSSTRQRKHILTEFISKSVIFPNKEESVSCMSVAILYNESKKKINQHSFEDTNAPIKCKLKSGDRN